MASLASVASIAGAAGSICDSCRSFLVLLPVTVPFWLSLPAFVTRNAVLRLQNADAIADLRNFGAAASLMTGSGSAVFGAFETKDTADAAFAALEKRYDRVFRCETCMESVIEQI